MERSLGQISILVKDYDEALSFYISILGFELVEDTQLNSEKRWVVIKPRNTNGQGCNLLLAKASNAHQEYFIGNQSGGRVFLFLYTDDLNRDYELLVKNAVEIVRAPKEEKYGKVLVFSDLYGNLWDLIEQAK
ncbi:MAG: VOC family protein [Bacteroidetes bacterium]|nr:VOC family protein [Bacteroidota bacterium]